MRCIYPSTSLLAGKVLIGGSFTTVNGLSQTNIARLNADGSLDTTFVASADGIIRAMAIQNDDSVLIAGEFSNVNGSPANRLARLSGTGAVDSSFASALFPGIGDSNSVAIQDDGRIIVVGQFLTANGLTRHPLHCVCCHGAVDPTINFGDEREWRYQRGRDSAGRSVCCAGRRIHPVHNDQSAPYLTRIYGGSVTGSGKFEFTSAYQVTEDGLQASSRCDAPAAPADRIRTAVAVSRSNSTPAGAAVRSQLHDGCHERILRAR